MARTRTKTVIGLDIEPSHLAAAEASVNGRVTVQRAAVAPLAPGIVRDGEVADGEALSAALKQFFADHNLPKRVRLGVANQRIVVRLMELPPLEPGNELDAAVRFQAQENIPMPLDQAVLDYQPLGRVESEQGERLRVMLVAARRDMIDRLLVAARGAGLRPEGIDLSAFAMIRALGPGPAEVADPDATQGGALYVNVADMTNLAIASGAACHFTRVAAVGVGSMVAELAERRGLTLEHAEQWLSHVGLSTPLEAVEGDPEIVTEARSVLAAGADRIIDEVRNSLDFYATQGGAVVVERVVVSGSAVAVPGFVEQLGHGVTLPVEAGVVAEARPGALGSIDATRVAVAAGLSVAEVTP
jgi:type IV pilus assembly protein PilM